MKKQWRGLVIGISAIILAAAGCGKKDMDAAPENEPSAEAQMPEEEKPQEELPEALPMEFLFSSGAGAWGTLFTLNQDGSFEGSYGDSDMGDTGEGYPNGKHYFCEFQGRFGNFRWIDAHTCSMVLEELNYTNEEGGEWIEDGILYAASSPNGLVTDDGSAVGKEFVFYMPDTPIEELSEDFLSWWPGRYTWDGETPGTLSCYGIWNKETGAGFFTDDICEACGGTISPQTGVCNQCGKVRE